MLKFIWGLTAVAGLAVATWGFETHLIQPREERSESLRADLENLEKEINTLLGEFPDLTKPKADLKKQEAELLRLRQKVTLWKSKILRAAELNVLLPPEAERETDETFSPYVRENIAIQTADSFETIKAYVNTLEKASPLINLLRLRLVPDKEKPGILQAEITAQVTHA